MKYIFLLWLCITLQGASPHEITNHMPTVLVQKTTPAHILDNGIGELDFVVNDNHGSLVEESFETYTEETLTSRDYSDEVGNKNSEETVDDHIVTTHGPVEGVREGNLMHYYDIPYGIFRNKFEAPISPESWTTILKNQKHTVKCPQIDGDTYVGNKNCLTLSVFTRANVINGSVLFYIHDSDFSTGSGDPTIYDPVGIVNRNVILVLPNYRLGPLGFLCLRNSTAPGNAALKDLTLALEWTRNNIRKFGGDPTNIAVSGDGASAALAGYLALSLKSRKFISKVIVDSGSALSYWAIDRNPIDSATKLAEIIRNDTREKLLHDDLFGDDSLDQEKLVKLAQNVVLRPCIEQPAEGSLITATPWKILGTDNINISFIIGTANHAGLLEALEHDKSSIEEFNENFMSFLPNDLSFETKSEIKNVVVSLKAQYFGRGNISLKQSKELSLYHTDASYLSPSLRLARALVKAGARVYLYEFLFVGALNKKLLSLEDPPGYGAVRGDIVGYLFPNLMNTPSQDNALRDADENQNKETVEKRIVNMMTDLWVSFLETGEPSAEGINWLPLNSTTDLAEDYLSIGNETRPGNGIHPGRLRVWTEIYRLYFVDRNGGGLTCHNSLAPFAVVLITLLKFLVG